ncbi:hypothetical protein NDU88_004613 [Pleurodeles waltl]|uniref:Uncharacterized protein n=1 Tax=Pleurodeles waltl TaxID=8319 RepID=A0AAV7SJ93_PLEWA|nr:hypothetical protein NDU88_004613 [Pleurodeles waltl]
MGCPSLSIHLQLVKEQYVSCTRPQAHHDDIAALQSSLRGAFFFPFFLSFLLSSAPQRFWQPLHSWHSLQNTGLSLPRSIASVRRSERTQPYCGKGHHWQ